MYSFEIAINFVENTILVKKKGHIHQFLILKKAKKRVLKN